MANMSSIEKIFVNSKLDRWYHRNFGLARLLRTFHVGEAKDTLEVGCGIGITTEILAAHLSTSHVTAVDNDAEQINLAKYRVRKPNVFFVQGDATKLTYAPATFDSCFASFLFHHVEEYPKAINEMHRVLKPSGRLYVIELSLPGVKPNKRQIGVELTKAGFTLNKVKGNTSLFIECQKR